MENEKRRGEMKNKKVFERDQADDKMLTSNREFGN